MWHASSVQHGPGPDYPVLRIRGPADQNLLSSIVRRTLTGSGDALLGEWLEVSEVAVHLKRRLTPAEWGDRPWGMDLRKTPEARERLAPVLHLLPIGWDEL